MTRAFAFSMSAHLLVALLLKAPAARSQSYCGLELNAISYDLSTGFRMRLFGSKTQSVAVLRVPPALTRAFIVYLSIAWTVLVGLFSHSFVFTNLDGSGPRASIAALSDHVMKKHLGLRVRVHSLRTTQHSLAVKARAAGLISEQQLNALCTQRMHSRKSADDHYLLVSQVEVEDDATNACAALDAFRASLAAPPPAPQRLPASSPPRAVPSEQKQDLEVVPQFALPPQSSPHALSVRSTPPLPRSPEPVRRGARERWSRAEEQFLNNSATSQYRDRSFCSFQTIWREGERQHVWDVPRDASHLRSKWYTPFLRLFCLFTCSLLVLSLLSLCCPCVVDVLSLCCPCVLCCRCVCCRCVVAGCVRCVVAVLSLCCSTVLSLPVGGHWVTTGICWI